MNGYKVRYRGGPMAGRIEMVQHKPAAQTATLRHIPKSRRRVKAPDKYTPYSQVSVRAWNAKEKFGVYSQVYTPLKDGSILMVWVEQ